MVRVVLDPSVPASQLPASQRVPESDATSWHAATARVLRRLELGGGYGGYGGRQSVSLQARLIEASALSASNVRLSLHQRRQEAQGQQGWSLSPGYIISVRLLAAFCDPYETLPSWPGSPDVGHPWVLCSLALVPSDSSPVVAADNVPPKLGLHFASESGIYARYTRHLSVCQLLTAQTLTPSQAKDSFIAATGSCAALRRM